MVVETSHFWGTHGLRLAADVMGDVNRVPIVFIPGAGQTRRSWQRAANRLARHGYHVISLDLRGHGDSEWASDADYSIDAFVGDVCAVVSTLSSPPVLIGASIGGIAALLAIGENSATPARGLVLVDVVPGMPGEALDRIRSFMSAGAHGFASADEAAAAIARYLPHRQRPNSAEGLKHNLRSAADGRFYWHWDPAFHAGSKQRSDQGMLDRMAAAARAIKIPTMLVSGSRSEVVNSEGAAQLLSLIPHATWYSVDGAAHMVAGDKNDAFYSAVGEFIASLPTDIEAGRP